MKLNRLEQLYRAMRAQTIERYKFKFSRNNTIFDVFFFIDIIPFELLLGCVGTQFAFSLEVRRGFFINPYLDPETFRGLCNALKLQPNPDNPFKTTAFFEDFNKAIPAVVNKKNIPLSHEIGSYKREVEEADKIYFCGWRNNSLRSENVTQNNLRKTRQLLGRRAYERCKYLNVSSCWTDNADAEVKLTINF